MVKPAEKYLEEALETLRERAKLRDSEDGERSLPRAVTLFNAWRKALGREEALLNEVDGAIFMICLKVARSANGVYHQDDYVDIIGYAALLAEAAERAKV